MAEAVRARADAGPNGSGESGSSGASRGSWLTRLTHCWTVHSLSLRHADPAGELGEADRSARSGRDALLGDGREHSAVARQPRPPTCKEGSQPIVLVVGAEALATKKRAKRARIRLEWPSSDGWPDMWPPLEPDMGVHPLEDAHGLRQATTMYALVESAIAHAAGENRYSPQPHDR